MKNKIMDQFKNLVAFNAAISEADEDIQMIQKEMSTHGFDKNYVAALDEMKQKVIYYRYQKVNICLELLIKLRIWKMNREND